MNRPSAICLGAVLLTIVAAPLWGGNEPWYPGDGPKDIVSPEVHEDGRVTVRLYAPEAEEVELTFALAGEGEVRRSQREGVWSFTVGPVDPGVYSYGFRVDGTLTVDPVNPWFKLYGVMRNLVEVPADPPAPYARRSVPHGTVRIHHYRSEVLEEERRLRVYTPPEYELHPERRYPVLYLLHGSGDTERAWTETGRAHLVADNLLAAGEAKPAIIVMPHGHAVRDDSRDGVASGVENQRAYERELTEQVMPWIERRYRVKEGPGNTAIAGLSMGGGQSLAIGLRNPERFGWVGAFSSAIYASDAEALAERYPEVAMDPEGVNERLRLLWIACGRDDFLLEQNQRFIGWLEEQQVEHEYYSTPGGHGWYNWRLYLSRFLPRLFREEDATGGIAERGE